MARTRKPNHTGTPKLPRLYIENFEKCSEWLLLEYRHCIETWENTVFTNVADRALYEALTKFARTPRASARGGMEMGELRETPPASAGGGIADSGASVRRSPLERLKEYHPRRTLALDPEAKVPLRTSDFKKHDALVIGGILGNEGFTGKTGRFMTKKLGCCARNLGKIQLSIDSAAVVCKLIFLGMNLEDIELTRELEIQHDDGHSTILPYGYPVLEGKIILTPGLREYLERH